MRALLQLRWRLFVRRYQGQPLRTVALAFAFLWLLSIAALISAGSIAALVRSPGHAPFELLNVLLFGIWLFWALAPVLGFSLGGSYDVTAQLIYPIPPFRMFLANVLSSAFGPSVIILLVLLAGPVLGFTIRAGDTGSRLTAAGLCAATALVFGFHVIVFGQTAMLLFLGLLRTRRYQDLLIVLVPLVAILGWLGGHYVSRAAARFDYDRLFELRPSRYLAVLPSGFAARAMDHASWGEIGPFAAFLLLLVGVTVVVAAFGSLLMQRVYRGDITDALAPRRPVGGVARREAGPTLLQRLGLPAAFEAMALKELRHLWREPLLKSKLLSLIIVWLILFVSMPFRMPPHVVVGVVGLISVFPAFAFALNCLGYDGDGLNSLFLFPAPRALILLGKNVLALLMGVGGTTFGVIVAAVWLKQPAGVFVLLPFLWAFALVMVAGGNVVSVYFPMRAARRGENPFARGMEQGCISGLIRMLVFSITLAASLPVAAGYVLPQLLHAHVLFGVTALLAIIYAIVVYSLVLPHAAEALLRREPEILEVCTAAE